MSEIKGEETKDEIIHQENQLIKDVKNIDAKPMHETDKASTTMVLEPDHPMMERFQAALKSHLLKQIDRIANQINELENGIKKKESEKEETGLNLYAMQQEMFRQQKNLNNFEETINKLVEERVILDEAVVAKKSNWKEEINRLNIEKKKEMKMKAELQKLQAIEREMIKWNEEVESEIAVSQRITEKTYKDKLKAIENKRKWDLYILNLMTDVTNHETEMRLLEGEIDVKLEEKETLNQTLADSAADLQALVNEQKRLMTAWKGVIAKINNSNSGYNALKNELKMCQEAFTSLNAERESYKASVMQEMKKGEKFSIVRTRVEYDFQKVQLELKGMLEKKNIQEAKIANLSSIIQQTENDYNVKKSETDKDEEQLKQVRIIFEKIFEERRLIEDNALSLLQNQMFNVQSASHLNKLIRQSREKSRKQQFEIIQQENKISQRFYEVEELKDSITQKNQIIEEMNRDLNLVEEELKKYEGEISKCHFAIMQKRGNYANLTRKIEKWAEKTGYGKPGLTPTQQRIMELEKTNAEIQVKNDKLQAFWLLQQTNNVKLSQQRNEQLKDISLLRRQVLLFQQRALKIEGEIENEKKIQNDINKSINNLQMKVCALNADLINKKGHKENLGKENTVVQSQFLHDLKDAEIVHVKLKAEIKDLESGLEEMAETMLATQREILAWEKKITTALEAKNSIARRRRGAGDVGQMKIEIHKMEIRYGQLKRVQEKLICDLEQCVLRRDSILDNADALEQRQARTFISKSSFEKKIQTLKKDIQSLLNDSKKFDAMIHDIQLGHEEIQKDINEKEEYLKQMDETTQKLDLQLEEGKLFKCQNLEMIIKKQKKAKMYELLKAGKHKMLFKSQESLEKEMLKAKNKNEVLISVVENLIEDFPAYRFYLKKIYNSLCAKPS